MRWSWPMTLALPVRPIAAPIGSGPVPAALSSRPELPQATSADASKEALSSREAARSDLCGAWVMLA
jgi:hypothetical protein